MQSPPRNRAAVGNTGVVSAATNGLAIVVLVSLGLRQVLQLSAADVARGAALFVFIVLLAVRYLPHHHPFPLFGPANRITTLRAALVSLVGGFVGAPETAIVATTAAGLALVVTALDGLDGWFARRTAMESVFGARFDMEVDALLILILSLLAWTHGKAPIWVVWSGLLRYIFVAAGWLADWMRRPLPPSRRRQSVCVLQVAALIAVVLPQIRPPLSVRLAAAALGLLVCSFAIDTWWLWRHRPAARLPVHS